MVCAFAMLPRNRFSLVSALAVSLAVVTAAVLGVGDTAIRMSLGRPLDLYLDFWLLGSVWHLLDGSLGTVLATAVAVGAVGMAFSTVALLWLLLRPPDGVRPPLSTLVGTIALLVVIGMGVTAERTGALGLGVDAPALKLVAGQARYFASMAEARERFRDDLARVRDSYADHPGLLSRLRDKDVIVAFVESYGVAALYDDRYAPVVGPRMDDLERRMSAAGLALASGRLVAPSQGGQSWFGHGSLLSGLWLDSQMRYDMMLSVGRQTLIDDFEQIGHRTVALMPAITMAWPEGERLGYDQIYARNDIDYAGPPLNWVTMPDQFSWSFLENTIRRDGTRPLFAEVGLISSHAPWTPILPVLEAWDGIGDGAVFAAWENAGEEPRDLWRDADKVREHYARSVDYAVHTMTAYAERYLDDGTLLIVLGDHQPAPLITGDGATWEVPVHVMSGDSALVAPFLDWGFAQGAWPDPIVEPLGMDYFRDWFIRAYSGE
jgi:hypothetical protein